MLWRDIYIKRGMTRKYYLNLNDRPFNAIKSGMKRVEARVPTSKDTTPYNLLTKGDLLSFTNSKTGDVLCASIIEVRHYADALSMLRSENLDRLLSSGIRDIEQAAKGFEQFGEYREGIQKNGIYAIHIDNVTF